MSPIGRLLGAQVPADLADWLDFVAIGALLALTWGAPPMVFALLAVAVGLPYLLIGPVAGVLVDKASTRTVLVASNLGRALATAALGGLMLIVWTPAQVFLANAAMSLLAALMVLGLPPMPAARSEHAAAGLIGELRRGLRLIRGSAALTGALGLSAAGYFAVFLYDALIPLMTRDLGFDATVLGFAIASVGAGGVLGALWLGAGKDHSRPFAWAGAGALLGALAVISLWVAEQFALAMPVWLFLLPFALAGVA